jgi:hypothetical protein
MPPGQSCQPKSCAGKCGTIGYDSCGIPIYCGGCPNGQVCSMNMCVPQGSVDAGCSSMMPMCTVGNIHLCGVVSDGCNHRINCSCPAGQHCNAGVCGPPPPECDGGKCGEIKNACGSGDVACGSCMGATQCTGNQCVPCTPPTCGTQMCGEVSNGCGPSVSCGNCMNNQLCENGMCCTPMTCAALLDAGAVGGCNPIDLGCGVRKACINCQNGYECMNNQCTKCTVKTCADYGNMGCGHSDNCGGSLNCCTAGTTCCNGACCTSGEVCYGGGCCQPHGCDPNMPPGPQPDGCGGTIYCPGN